MTDRDVLADRYDLLLLDLDGVVYIGEHAVPGAAESLEELRRRGARACYVTNNASRSAAAVAGLLSRLAVPAVADDVLTSAQASAQLLAERLPGGAAVLVVGTAALADEVAAAGLKPVRCADEKPIAVVQGYGPDVGWRQLAEATRTLTAGAWWVATNTDRTLPSAHGPLPGNGAMVAALAVSTGREPDVVVGKPAPELFSAAARRFAARRPLVVGDRLDTDIQGAVRAGCDSVFVLTGVGTADDVLRADPSRRPTYLANDLGDLLRPYPDVVTSDAGARCREWTVQRTEGLCFLSGEGLPVDALRALCAVVWSEPEPPPRIVSGSPRAAVVLEQLGLSEQGPELHQVQDARFH